MGNRFYIEPTGYCQLKCPLCPTPNFKKERQGYMSLDKFLKLVDDALENNYMKAGDDVHLYGFGEPTLHKNLPQMVSKFTSNGITTKINTNGLLLDERMLDELSHAGITKILISIDGNSEEDYLKYRIGGNFNKLIENLKAISNRSRSYQLEGQIILFPHNIDKKDEFIDFYQKIGLDILVLKKARLWMEEREQDKTLIDLPSEFQRKKLENEIGECNFKNEMGMIFWNGDLTICNSDPFGENKVGNIFSEGVEIWDSKKFKEMREKGGNRKLSSCSNCGYGDSYSEKIKLK